MAGTVALAGSPKLEMYETYNLLHSPGESEEQVGVGFEMVVVNVGLI